MNGGGTAQNRTVPDLSKLVESLPDGAVLTDPDVVAGYRQDWARDPDAGTPLAVVRATCTADVQETRRWAKAHRVLGVPRGAGTSLSGGSTGVASSDGRAAGSGCCGTFPAGEVRASTGGARGSTGGASVR